MLSFIVSDERKLAILSKFVNKEDAQNAISKHAILDEELVEVLPQEWKLDKDEEVLVPSLKEFFTESAWLIVEAGLKCLQENCNTGTYTVYIN